MESNWQIEHPCPQCGAPVTLDETDHILSCMYCRVRFFIAGGKYFRYYLSPRDSDGDPDLLFFPYWRFRGMAFSCSGLEMESRILDVSLPAYRSRLFPATLGIKPQVLKLRYVAPGLPGKFTPAALSFEDASGARENPVSQTQFQNAPGVLLKSFIGETLSLIYAPFLVRDASIHDAILKRPVCRMPENPEDFPQRFEQPTEQVKFIPTLCPRCGWDLQGEKETLVLGCRNCDSVWQEGKSALESVEFAVSSSKDPSAVYLPFWRLRASVEGLELESYADLVRLANMPRVVQSGWERKRLHFLVPAFKVQPLLFLRLSKVLTFAQPDQPEEGALPKTQAFPATLPWSEAFESLKVFLASIAIPKRLVFPLLPKISLKLEHVSLLYAPFIENRGEYIHPDTQVSISKNALKWGKFI